MLHTHRKFFAVIHASGIYHGVTNAAVALQSGADGVALIDQYCDEEDLEEIAVKTKQTFPAATVLVNVLRNTPVARRIAGLVGFGCADSRERCGVWCDSFDPDPEWMLDSLTKSGIPFFAGVGFKYQGESELEAGWNLAYAKHFVRAGVPFVPMTSGPGTGHPPPTEKLAAYRRLLGPYCPLAVASGVSAENVGDMLPLASHFLVGTSIEDPASRAVIPDRVRELAGIVRAFNEKHGLQK